MVGASCGTAHSAPSPTSILRSSLRATPPAFDPACSASFDEGLALVTMFALGCVDRDAPLPRVVSGGVTLSALASIGCVDHGRFVVAGDMGAVWAWQASDGRLVRGLRTRSATGTWAIDAVGEAPREWSHGHQPTAVMVDADGQAFTLGVADGELTQDASLTTLDARETLRTQVERGGMLVSLRAERVIDAGAHDSDESATHYRGYIVAYRLPGQAWHATRALPITRELERLAWSTLLLLADENRVVLQVGRVLYSASLAADAPWSVAGILPSDDVLWVGELARRVCAIVRDGLTYAPFAEVTPLGLPLAAATKVTIAGSFLVIETRENLATRYRVTTRIYRREAVLAGETTPAVLALDDFWDPIAARCGAGVVVSSKRRSLFIDGELVARELETPPLER